MLKKIKNVFTCLLLVIVIAFASTSLAYANESSEGVEKSSITVGMEYVNPDESLQVQPRITISNDDGYARLDYMAGGQYVKWEVHPNTIAPYHFSGTLKIYDLNKSGKLIKTFDISETGFGSEGDICDVAYLPKGHYEARLRGTVYVGIGEFRVSSLANIDFSK